MAAASAAAFLASCSVDSQSVIVTNDSELSRENETIELCFTNLKKADRSLTAENVIVCDFLGVQVPCQVYTETNGCEKLVFQASVDAGFKKAFSAILDSNVTTIITCVVLYLSGIGTIRGFAVTLGLGVVVSMFTAITITKFLLKQLVGLNIKNRKLFCAK